MARAPTPGEGDGVEAFFARCGLPPDARLDCHALARRLFPGADSSSSSSSFSSIADARPQGYCSYTLCVGRDGILQFRPPAHRLRAALADAARGVYGDLAPRTQLLAPLVPPSSLSRPSGGRGGGGGGGGGGVVWPAGEERRPGPDGDGGVRGGDHHGGSLDVVLMARVPGVSLAELRASTKKKKKGEKGPPASPPQRRRQRESVVGQFARFIATGWAHGRPASDPAVSSLRGRVGGSIRWRLGEMGARLPERFRPVVSRILARLEEVVALPWVLTHGDIVPANVMVQPASDMSGDVVVTGLLDWAEAEYLPFGVGLYGLESLLGETDGNGRFAYYSDERELREMFWARLEAELPGVGLRPGTCLRELVEEAHALGVLLWYGIAFDDGKLDRVVEEGKDEAEVRRLDLFFKGEEMPGHHGAGDETNGDDAVPTDADLVKRLNLPRQAILGV